MAVMLRVVMQPRKLRVLPLNLHFGTLRKKILTSVDQKITTTNQKLSALTHTTKIRGRY